MGGYFTRAAKAACEPAPLPHAAHGIWVGAQLEQCPLVKPARSQLACTRGQRRSRRDTQARTQLAADRSLLAAAENGTAFRAAQQAVYDDLYWKPSLEYAARLGVTLPLVVGQASACFTPE